MKSRKRISRRILRRFLGLAAATFALGANAAIVPGDGDDLQPARTDRDEWAQSDDSGAEAERGGYQHTFPLPSSTARVPYGDARAHLRVLDEHGRKLVQLPLHGASMVGPFAPGAFTVLMRAGGLTEVHRIRIGIDTLPYLHFTETV